MERVAFLQHHSEAPRYNRTLLIDSLLLVYLIYIYQLGGNWEAVITQDAMRQRWRHVDEMKACRSV